MHKVLIVSPNDIRIGPNKTTWTPLVIASAAAVMESSGCTVKVFDRLAHCHAAVGNLERAVRTQWLAVKQEPHSPLIRRNYKRFLSRASGARSE